MRRQIARLICMVVLCTTMFSTIQTYAITPLDPSADASLTLHYQKEGQVFPDLQISIHRVAEAFPDGTFKLIAPFFSYPVNIHNVTSQAQWKNIATTLGSYIVANQIAPDRVEKTDEAGIAAFEHLETGLYLVREVVAENNNGTYVFNQFMVYLPTPQTDGSFDYHVEANPKCVNYVPKTEYRVTKLWNDAGHQTDRPAQITVDIYKDGALHESQILDASNNWSYIWYVSDDDHSEWVVVERAVSEDYTVTVQQNGSSFSIINTYKSSGDIPDIPQTGDTINLMPWTLTMCISGFMLIIASVYSRRKRSE